MAVEAYDLGEQARIELETATDPSVVRLEVWPERGGGVPSVLTYPADGIVRAATGEYYYDYTTEVPGRLFYRWNCSGPIVVDEDFFLVRTSAFSGGSEPAVLGDVDITWRATIEFDASGDGTLVEISDNGASVEHDDVGAFTLSFPACEVVFVESLVLQTASGVGDGNEAHPHAVDPDGTMAIHTDVNGSRNDPGDGDRLYVTLRLRNLA